MRKLVFLTAFVALTALLFQSAFAAEWEIYVRGKIFNNMKISDGKFYVPVKSFLDALKLSYAQNASGVIVIMREPGYKHNLDFRGNSALFVFEDTEFELATKNFNNSTYVDLDSIGKYLDLEITKTPETQIIDVVDKVQRQKHQQAIEKWEAYEKRMNAKPEDDPGQGGSGDYDPNAPVKQVGETEGFLDQTQWEARWTAKVKNYADKPVNNVRVILNVLDGNKEKLDSQVKVIGTMNPGDQASAEFYWQSTTHIMAYPEIEIQHDPLPETRLIETKE